MIKIIRLIIFLALIPVCINANIIIESQPTGQNFQWYSETGTWADSTSVCTATGCTALSSRYTSARYSGRYAYFQPDLAQGGDYEVSTAWGDAGIDGALFQIYHNSGTTNLYIDQDDARKDTWVSLGTFHFAPGTTGKVAMSRGTATQGFLRSAACRFRLVAAQSPTPDPNLTPTPTPSVIGEVRGVWVTRWDYSTATHVRNIISTIAARNFNTIFFQVRGEADAFYDSNYEPWAARLSGTLGQDPGWDPLALAIQEAHNQGLELHAWINTMTCWGQSTPPPVSIPEHIYNAHPEWVMVSDTGQPMPCNGDYIFIAPGNLQVQSHIRNVCKDIYTRYNVDGLHLDYIRYPSSRYSHDSATTDRFQNDNPGTLPWEDFMRETVNELVTGIYQDILVYRPEVKLTAATIGVYEDIWAWHSNQGYHNCYQDSLGWLRMSIIDAIIPMVYWNMSGPGRNPPYFDVLTDYYMTRRAGRHVYMGMSGNYSNFSEIAAQANYTRQSGAEGHVTFAYSYIQSHSYWDEYESQLYTQSAPVPDMPWKNSPTATPIVMTPTETPTHTLTRTPTHTPTDTVTPQSSLTPTFTPTSIPPTATFTPTQLPSPTPGPTDTHVPTMTPSASPVPSSTPQATVTPTPNPEEYRPTILVAGYWDTNLHHGQGDLTIMAMVQNQAQDYRSTNVELYWWGFPLDVELYDDGLHGDGLSDDGLFSVKVRIDARVGLSNVLLDIVASSHQLESSAWPYFKVQ